MPPPSNPSPLTSAHPTAQMQRPQVYVPNVSTSNSYSSLADLFIPPVSQTTRKSPSVPLPHVSSQASVPLAKTYADKTKPLTSGSPPSPPRQKPAPLLPTPPSTMDQRPEPSPQILIFSNSMCSRIREERFHRGKTTKLIAKSGATIGDIQTLMEQTSNYNPEFVILQAWTNSTSRESLENCERMSRRLIYATQDKFPNAKIIISGVLPRFWNDKANYTSHNLNQIFRENCNQSKRVNFVDHETWYLTANRELRQDLYWDNVHLNNRGLGRLVMNLRKAIDNWSSANEYQQKNLHQYTVIPMT